MMKLAIVLMLIICLMVPFACAREESEVVEKPTLTEEQQELWVERGVLPVSTIEEASRLVGYQVATPFIPEGFLPGDFELNQLGFPPQLGGEWGDGKRVVQRQWTWPDDPKINILLIQHPGTDVSGEPIEICGRPGGREFFEAGDGREYPLVVLHWRDGDMVYSLGGILGGPLTEEILNQMIACSVRAESVRAE